MCRSLTTLPAILLFSTSQILFELVFFSLEWELASRHHLLLYAPGSSCENLGNLVDIS